MAKMIPSTRTEGVNFIFLKQSKKLANWVYLCVSCQFGH